MIQKNFLLTQVQEQSERVWQDQVCGLGLRLILTMAIASTGGLAIFFRRLPPEVPLWFSQPWGQGQLTQPVWLWLLPGSLIIIGATATIVAGIVFREEKLLARILIGGATLIGFLLSLALFNIVKLVI